MFLTIPCCVFAQLGIMTLPMRNDIGSKFHGSRYRRDPGRIPRSIVSHNVIQITTPLTESKMVRQSMVLLNYSFRYFNFLSNGCVSDFIFELDSIQIHILGKHIDCRKLDI